MAREARAEPPTFLILACTLFVEIFMTLTSFFLWGTVVSAFLPNWNALTDRMNADMQLIETCGTACPGNVVYLKHLADEAKASAYPIAEINRIVNYTFVYATDEQIYGSGNHHWPSALESVDKRHANCVGQAVLKATLAMMIGIPPTKLRLAVTRGHMLLLYRDTDEWLVLNNTTLVKVPLHRFKPTISAEFSWTRGT
jgi:predicted transglutaminase-like cysteine proteinase